MSNTGVVVDPVMVGDGGSSVASLDAATRTTRITTTNQERFADLPLPLVSGTNLAADTYYYPTDGQCMLGWNAGISIAGKLIMATGTATLKFYGTNKETPVLSDWIDITQQFVGTNGNTGHTSITITGSTVNFAYYIIDFPYEKFRAELVIDDATNTISFDAYLKAK